MRVAVDGEQSKTSSVCSVRSVRDKKYLWETKKTVENKNVCVIKYCVI